VAEIDVDPLGMPCQTPIAPDEITAGEAGGHATIIPPTSNVASAHALKLTRSPTSTQTRDPHGDQLYNIRHERGTGFGPGNGAAIPPRTPAVLTKTQVVMQNASTTRLIVVAG
jgi:hypothetical protein